MAMHFDGHQTYLTRYVEAVGVRPTEPEFYHPYQRPVGQLCSTQFARLKVLGGVVAKPHKAHHLPWWVDENSALVVGRLGH